MITETLIKKFFEGKCDAREAAIVQAWLEEWEGFQPGDNLSPDKSAKLWKSINKNAVSESARYAWLKRTAVAASLLLVVGLSWQFIMKTSKPATNGITTLAQTKNVFNGSSQKMALTLSDGSIVELSPNSTLSYPESFNPLKRDVILNGEATFTIAKDAARPFSVYSNSVLITVLGTRFTVNSYQADDAAKVILHEGKVMVKIAHSSSRDDKKEYYLTPGDIFVFKKAIKSSPAVSEKPVATAKGISGDTLSARVLHLEMDNEDRYVFNNYPLDVVFDQLQVIYNTRIIYNKAELGNRSFIGKIDKKDPLEHILKSITLLTGFDLRQQGDTFLISPAAKRY